MKTLLSWITSLFILQTAFSQPDLSSIKNLTYSDVYKVYVNGTEKWVLEGKESLQTRGFVVEQAPDINYQSFVNFDLPQSGAAQISIVVTGGFQSFDFRPFALADALNPIVVGDTIKLQISDPSHLVLRINGSWDNVLCLFANPYHIKPNPAEVTYYFDNSQVHDYYTGSPGIDPSDPGNDIQSRDEVSAITLNDGESLYLEEGAILRARIEVAKNANDVKIFGRGTLAFGLGHVENFSVISADGSTNNRLKVEGITVCDAPGWILRMFSPKDFLVENYKTVCSWHFNTDGIQFAGNTGEIRNCFLVCNDDNFSIPSYVRDTEIHHITLWNLFNGGAVNLGWGNPNLQNVNFHDLTILRSGDCCDIDPSKPTLEVERRKAPITIMSYGGLNIDGVTFKDVVMEEIIKQGSWLHLNSNIENKESASGTLKNFTLENITVLNINKKWGLIKGTDNGVENITLKNVVINGQMVQTLDDAGLTLMNADEEDVHIIPGTLYSDPPTAPANLTAKGVSGNAIQLNWEHTGDTEFGFEIYRSTDNGAIWRKRTTIGANIKSYIDDGLQPVTKYLYRISAYNNAGSSEFTAVAKATTLHDIPTAPSDISITAVSATTLNVIWTDKADNEDAYFILRSKDGGDFKQVAQLSAESTSFTDRGLIPETEYSYQVGVINESGSDTSKTATYTMPGIGEPVNLIVNGSFESGTDYWSPYWGSQACSIEATTDQAFQGNNSGHVYARTSQFSGIQQSITQVLKNNGKGKYYVSAWIKSPAGANQVYVQTQLVINGAKNYQGGSKLIGNSEWQHSSGILDFQWTGELESALFYVETNDATTTKDFYVDSCWMNVVTSPIALSAEAVSQSSIDLTWKLNADSVKASNVYRSLNGTSFDSIYGSLDEQTYADNNLLPNTKYYYKVKIEYSLGAVDYSDVISVSTLGDAPSAPSDLTTEVIGGSQIDISWTDNATNETSQVIEYRIKDGDWETAAIINKNVTSYGVIGLTDKTTYEFRLKAINANGDSDFSNVAEGTTDGTIGFEWMKVSDNINAVLYPNPTRGTAYLSVHVQEQSKLTVHIINRLGQTIDEVYSGFANGELQIELPQFESLPNDMYLILIQQNYSQGTQQKVLKLLKY